MSSPKVSRIAGLPSIDRLLNSNSLSDLINCFGRTEVKRVAQDTLAEIRQALKQGDAVDCDEPGIAAMVRASIERDRDLRLRPVFNLTGTLLHTNFGRATLPQTSIDAAVDVMSSPSNLEYDLAIGGRGERDSYLEAQICRLTGAEAATIVNNNAAAVMLLLNTLALGKEVPVSRGELVEIGGSFRIPEIMSRSGCRLIEVGTTNRTHRADFESALGAQTAMIMKVHQSNYVIEGFTAAVSESELSELCQSANIPFVVDLGSGALVNLESYGLPHEPTPMDALKQGADIVTFSGDKLLGGPQTGFIVGRKDLIDQMKSNPMKRALRCDKTTIAAMSALLQLYARPDQLPEQLPVLKIMMRDPNDLREIALAIMPELEAVLADTASVTIVDCESEIGSGALPNRSIPSLAIEIRPKDCSRKASNDIAARFRRLPIPVIGRVHQDRLLLDLRCLENPAAFCAQLAELEPAG